MTKNRRAAPFGTAPNQITRKQSLAECEVLTNRCMNRPKTQRRRPMLIGAHGLSEESDTAVLPRAR